jgi:hypothetical protein
LFSFSRHKSAIFSVLEEFKYFDCSFVTLIAASEATGTENTGTAHLFLRRGCGQEARRFHFLGSTNKP